MKMMIASQEIKEVLDRFMLLYIFIFTHEKGCFFFRTRVNFIKYKVPEFQTKMIPSSDFSIFEGITLFISFLGFVFNSLIIYGITKTKKTRSISDFALNLNLSISDLILCLTWITVTFYSMSKETTLFDLEITCRVEGLILYAFLGSSVFTLFSIAAFHYKTVVLEMELASKRRVLVVITMIWLLAITGSLFSNGLFTGTYGFTVQSSGLYCINDFTEMHLLERVFNSGIVFILVIAPLCFILIYYRIWKKLGLNRRQLFLKRHQATGETERVNINKMIIRRAIAVSSAFAFVFYYDAGLFAYQIVTGNRVPWIYDAIGASIGATITVVNPILFFSLDVRSRKVILEIFFTGAKEKARELSSIRVD